MVAEQSPLPQSRMTQLRHRPADHRAVPHTRPFQCARLELGRCLVLSLRKGNEARDFITLYGRAAPVPPLAARSIGEHRPIHR